MAKRIIITGGGAVSGSRADYISKSKISKEEVNERKLFSSHESDLTRHKATKFLGGNDKPRDGELTELVFSLEKKDFKNFGENLEDQKAAMQEVVREGLNNLWKELGVKNVRYAAGIHLNTNNPHAHIIFMRDAFDINTGDPVNVPKIPRSWFWRNDGENSKLAKLFENAVVGKTMATPPQSVLTKLPEENLFLPAREFDNARIEKTLNRLSEVNNISPHWVENLTDNRSLFVSRQGALIFIRRDVEGKPTGYVYAQGYQPEETKGFFYIGDPKTATKYIIVENPKEALAALELSGHRDLSEVCFVASDKNKSPEAFTNFLRTRSNETSVRVIWSLGLNRDGVQEQTHYEELRASVLENRADNAPSLEFFSWSPKQGFGKDWSNQLAFRNLPGELNGIIKKVLVADEQIAEALDSQLTESYNTRAQETFRAVEIENVNDEFIVYEKTENGRGIEYGRFRQNAEELAAGEFTLLSVKGQSIEPLTVEDELDAINTLTNLFVEKLEQEFLEIEDANIASESEFLTEVSENVENAAEVLEVQPARQLSAKEITERLKEIPLEDVMPRLGLSLTYDRERREYAYTDNGKVFKIKVKNDLFCNRYDDDRGGKNPINLVMHVEGKSFAEARQFLLDNFGTEYIPQQTAEKAIVRVESGKQKQPFVMPEPNDNKLDNIHHYLTEERAISDVIVNGMIERGFLFANNFASPVFVNKDENENVKGASWRATIGTKRGDYTGSEKVDAWFYIGDLNTAKRFIVVESPIEAMSYFQLHQDSIDLETTAVISTATNSVPLSLVKLLERNAGADAELIIAYNNDAKGQDGAYYLLEKIGRLSMLKHKKHFENNLIETTAFAGQVMLDVPTLDDWNEDLKALRETERYETDSEHIAEELATELRPELPEETQQEITLESLQIISMEGRIKNLDGSERVFPVSFDSITEFDNYIKSEKPLNGSYKTDVVLNLSEGSAVKQTFLIGERHSENLEGLLKDEIRKLETMSKLDTYKNEVQEIENEIGGYKYILNAVQKIQTEESRQIAREENPAIIEAENRADYYEADLIKSAKVSVPQHLQSFGKAEILLARDNPNDRHFHVGYRFTIGGKVYEELPDRSQKAYAQGKESLSFGHSLLREKIHNYWQDNGEPKFTQAETTFEPNEEKFLAYLLHKSEISAREFYVKSFEPSFSIKPELNALEISMLRKWRELTKEDQFYKIEDVFAGSAMEANPKRNLMYKLVHEGLIKTEQDGVHTLVKGLQPLTPEALTLIGKKSFSQVLKSNDSILRESLNKKIDLYSGKLQDRRLSDNDRKFYAQQYQKVQTELQELDAKQTGATGDLLELTAPEATENVQDIVLGVKPGDDYDLLAENPLKGVYDIKAHKIHQAFRETYIGDVENSVGVAFAYRNRVVTIIGADEQGNMQVNFRAEGTTGEGRTQGYTLNQLINEGILSKEDFERVITISRTKQEIRAEFEKLNLHTEYRADYGSDLIYPNSAGFRVNSRQTDGDYLLFKNLENGEIVLSKFKVERDGEQNIYSFDESEKRTFENIALALEHLKAREEFFSAEKAAATELERNAEKSEAVQAKAWTYTLSELNEAVLSGEINFAIPGRQMRNVSDLVQILKDTRANGDEQNIAIAETQLNEFIRDYHRGAVLLAYAEGKPVPENVLEEYPQIAEARARKAAATILKPSEQTGRIESRIAKILHAHNLGDEIAAAQEGFYVRLKNEPFMDLHITKDYGSNLIRLTHYYEQNGDLMHDGEMNFHLTDGKLTLNQVAVGWYGTPRYAYDRSFANMFSKNLLDQGFETAQLVRPQDEFQEQTEISIEQSNREYIELENLIAQDNPSGKAVKVFEIVNPSGVKSWLADEYWNGSAEAKNQMQEDGLSETGRMATIYTDADWTDLQEINDVALGQLLLDKDKFLEEFKSNFTQISEEEFKIQARNPEIVDTIAVENIVPVENRTGRAVEVLEVKGESSLKIWVAKEYWERETESGTVKSEMNANGQTETGRVGTIYTDAAVNKLNLIDEAAEAQLAIKEKTGQEKIDEFVKFLKSEYPAIGFSAGYIGNFTPQGDEARYSVYTKIEYQGQWGTQYASFGSYGSYDELASAVFETNNFDEFLYAWQRTEQFQSNVEIINTLDRMVATGDRPLARYLSGEAKPPRVYSDIERAVFFEQYKAAFNDDKTQKILEIIGNLKERQANVWDLSKVSDKISNFDLERAERNGFITVQKAYSSPEQNRVELTENGKIVFNYLDRQEILDEWKADEILLSLAKTAADVQTALDNKFGARGADNPWIARPDFDTNLVEIGKRGSINTQEINGHPDFAVWAIDEDLSTWNIALGKVYPATREDPEDFQFEPVNMRFSFDGAIEKLFNDHLLPETNLSTVRTATENRFPLALEADPNGVKKGTISLANEVREMLHEGKAIGNNIAYNKICEAHFGGTRAAGTFDARDAFDALELGVNLYLLDQGKAFVERNPQQVLTELRDLIRRLPTQADRTEEQQLFQQFSTVPTESYAAFAATGLKTGDILLEPSAGTAGLALWAKMAGIETHVNEISERRAGILKIIGFNSIHRQDAQFLNDTLDQSVKPSVILMNPPFSSTGGRTRNRTKYGAEHITDALLRLKDGGRLVAIVGEGMAFDKPTFTNWWSDVMNKYNVRANLGVPGDEYAKYGTTFGNQIIVIDKTGATPGSSMQEQLANVVQGDMPNLEAVLEITRKIGAERLTPAQEAEKAVVNEFKGIGEKGQIDFYAKENGYELKTVAGEIERIGMKPALDGSRDKFLRIYVKDERNITYMFAIGNRSIDKNAAPLFEAVSNGTIKKGDKLTFNGYIYQPLEKKAIEKIAEFPAEFASGERATKVNAYALDVVHEPTAAEIIASEPVQIKDTEIKDAEKIENPLTKLYEKARWEAIGIATGGRVEFLEQRGYRVIHGIAQGETRYDIAGVIGPATDAFIEKGLTVEKVKFSNFEINEKITRDYVKANPDKIFLFGDNLKATGFGGQARAMRGEVNAVGIPTKKEPNRAPWAYFTDSEIENNRTAIDKAFAKLAKFTPDTIIVFPKAGIGTGLAELENKAPETFAYLQDKLKEIGISEEVLNQAVAQTEVVKAERNVPEAVEKTVKVGATQETVEMQMDLLRSLPIEQRELEINDPLEDIDLYNAGAIESKGTVGFSNFHNAEMEADWEESQIKTLILNGLTDSQKIHIIGQFREVNNAVEFIIDGEKSSLLNRDNINQANELIENISSPKTVETKNAATGNLKDVSLELNRQYSKTAKALNEHFRQSGEIDFVADVMIFREETEVQAWINVIKYESFKVERNVVARIVQDSEDRYQYFVGDSSEEVSNIETLGNNLVAAVRALPTPQSPDFPVEATRTIVKSSEPASEEFDRTEYLSVRAERLSKSYGETAAALSNLLREQGRGDIVPEVFVEIAEDDLIARLDVYKIDTVNGNKSLIGEITRGTDQFQYTIGDESNEVYNLKDLSDSLIEDVNAYSVKELGINVVPEIDMQAWEKATTADRNYHEDEDNYSPEHVRAEYFQETMNLAASVKHLTEAVKDKPTTKKGEDALKKNKEKLANHIGDLSAHVDYTGQYFGQASEDYIKKELDAQNITIDSDYNVIVKETSKPNDQTTTSQPVKQGSLFDAAEETKIETAATEKAATAEGVSPIAEIKLPEGFRFLTDAEKAALPPHEKGKLIHGETTSIVKDAAVGSKWLNAYDGNVYEVISLVKEKYGQIAYVRDQDGNVDTEATTSGRSRPIFLPVVDAQTATAAVKEEDLNDVIGVGKNTAKRERIDSLGVVGYKPAKLTKGVDHPGDIVESASMAAVEPPDIRYTPKLNKKIISDGKLSSLQLEAVIYAGQRHEHRLPNGSRAGVFIGDGTGVGKGRELGGIAVDNWNQGRKRILWLSINYDLVPSTKRDLDDLMADNIPLASLDKHSIHDNLNDTVGDGVLFGSYATLIGKGKDEKTRLDQITKWLGEDGVIMFDEGHLAKNAVSFGLGAASQRGEAVVELQTGEKSNPNWRIVYSSATGATELAHMGYMERLGLWGEGTGFPDGFGEFYTTIDKGGIGAMEMVARDMKASGMYMSRSLSFRGVDYRQVHHQLTDDQKEIYNLASRAWSSVVVSFDDALRQTNSNTKARSLAYSRLWSSQQMFYRQLMTALKVPALIRETERVLDKGSEYTDPKTGEKSFVPAQVVIGVIGTGEARTKDQVSKAMQLGLDLDSLDFSPKNILLNVVETAYPTKRFTEEMDASGNLVKVPVIDGNGKHVESQEAMMMRDALLAELNEKITLPDNPLDQIVNYFGENAVAEITGRKRRIIIDPNTGVRSYVKRARDGVAMDKASQDEMSAFQANRKRIAIISQSASTGISLHSDKRSESANFRRVHITLETSWSADVQMQTFGRTHRSNQMMPPEYVLLSTDLGGEKRFLSTIAKRLSSLGALTKGDREQAGGGNLLQYDFENKYGVEAAKKIVGQLRDDSASLMTMLPDYGAVENQYHSDSLENVAINDALNMFMGGESSFQSKLGERSGLKMLYTMGLARKDGNAYTVTDKTMENLEVSRFLNRVLMLDVDTQNAVFDAFVREMENIIEHDKAMGLFDEGVQDIEGENIRFNGEPQIVATDKATGAHTFHNQIQADIPTHPVTLRQIAERNQVVRLNGVAIAESKNEGVFYQQTNSKNIVYVEYSNSRPNPKTGSMDRFYKYARPSGWQSSLLSEDELITKFTPVKLDQVKLFKDDAPMVVKDWWNKAVAETPKTQVQNYHLISGAVLPVWQRLSSSSEAGRQMSLKTVRIETQDGERVVGVHIPTNNINRVLRDLGVEKSYKTPEEVFDAVLNTKETVELVEGLKLKPEFLKQQPAIRVVNFADSQEKTVYNLGALREKVGLEYRYYIPTDPEKGIEVLTKFLDRFPAVDTTAKQNAVNKSEKAAEQNNGVSFTDKLQNAIDKLSANNGLGDGLLAKIGDQNSDFAKKAAALEGEHISKYWWMMKGEVNNKGQVLLNPASYEFARSLYKESMGIRVEQFDGLFNNELVTEKFFEALDRKQAEGGIYAESVASLKRTMEKGRELNGNGILVLLADERASMHESLHVASHVASLGKSLEERHARFDELRNHESYILAKNTLVNLHKTNSDGLLVEECFVECASGNGDKIGLLPDEAAEFTELWFKSFAEKNGIITKAEFKEITDESKRIRDRAYGIIAEQSGRTEFQSSGIERTGEPLGSVSSGELERGSYQTQSGNGVNENRVASQSLMDDSAYWAERKATIEDQLRQTYNISAEANLSEIEYAGFEDDNGGGSYSVQDVADNQWLEEKLAYQQKVEDNQRRSQLLNRALENGEAIKAGMLYQPATGETSEPPTEIKPKDEIFATFESVFKEAGIEKILESSDGVVKFETPGRYPVKYEMEITPGEIKFAEMEAISEKNNNVTASRGIYFSKNADGEFSYSGSFERSGNMTTTEPVVDRAVGAYDVEFWKSEKLGAEILVKKLDIEPELAAQIEPVNERNLARHHAEQLGRQILSDARLNEAEAALQKFERESNEIEFSAKITTDAGEEIRVVSLSKLEGERKALAQNQVQDDKQTGILAMIADDEHKTVEEIEKRAFAKTVKNLEKEQMPWINAVEAEAAKERNRLTENVRQAKLSRDSVSKETEAVIAQNSNKEGVQASLPIETVWSEQIKAAQRGDVETFTKLEVIHREQNIPRPNDVYARLRGVEILSDLAARSEDKNLRDKISSSPVEQEKLVLELKIGEKDISVKNSNLQDLSFYKDLQKQEKTAENETFLKPENFEDGSIEKMVAELAQIQKSEGEVYLPDNKTIIKAGFDEVTSRFVVQEIDATKKAVSYEATYDKNLPRYITHEKDYLIREISFKKDDNGKYVFEERKHTDENDKGEDYGSYTRNVQDVKSTTLEEARKFTREITQKVEKEIITPEYFEAKTERAKQAVSEQYNEKIQPVKDYHQDLLNESSQYRKEAKNERKAAISEALQPIRHMVDPFSPINGKLAWFTKPKETLNAHINPVEIVRNNPGVQIIRAVSSYVEHTLDARSLDKKANELAKAASELKAEFAGEKWEKAQQMSQNISDAVKAEESLRGRLKLDKDTSAELLKTPSRALTDAEVKTIGETAAKIGDAELLDKFHRIVEADPKLAESIGETAERVAARSLLTQTRAAEASMKAVEQVIQTEAGTVQIELNAAKFIEAQNLIKTGEVAQDWQNRLEMSRPKLNLQETSQMEEMMKSIGQPELDQFVNQQYAQIGGQMMKPIQSQELTAAEQALLKQMTLPQDVIQRFEQIAQSEATTDRLYQEAEKAIASNAQFQNTGQTFQTVNPGDMQEAASREFWKNDRAMREGLSQTELNRNRTIQAEAEKVIEVEAIEAAEAAEEVEAVEAVIAAA